MPDSDIESPMIVIAQKRVRKLWYLLWAGIIWSLFYTAVFGYLMVGLSNKLQDSCVQRQQARTALRTVILNDPDTGPDDITQLNVNLPIQVSC